MSFVLKLGPEDMAMLNHAEGVTVMCDLLSEKGQRLIIEMLPYLKLLFVPFMDEMSIL